MATATINWTPAGGTYSLSQDIEYKAIDDGGWTFHSNVSASANSVVISGLTNNIIYQYRITNKCAGGVNTISAVDEAIYIVCPSPVFATQGMTAVAFNFSNPGGDISSYVVDLLSGSDVVLDSKTFASPGSVVASTFTGLTPGTNYKIRVTTKAVGDQGEYTLACAPVLFTTDSCNPPTDVSAALS
jgi:hypothetical protein